ncbi:cytochrome c oxidase biogenesis protein Cmc1 like-domain-containing protein [Tricharina praecox]|uniref:cytochrome c oxidase biogenesis protein Cmc1 like-domain-containing protein n=1 Tax=Tricharina praecox TaxID=43433 RepID=UPI00221E9323|nr:cytochrome c oxidase biogenesis protein Cmc1 like-domain-containing protein [Tricharina praecox]KAI5850620.1 cytochrome c oxidase biogenesis protein Cmc1 like-domain-containing protein [Tricharina praecox]
MTMAAEKASPAAAAAAAASPLQPRNPMPLSASQEGQVRDLYYARVRGFCAEEIRLFAECARGRTVTATWACRTERGNMNKCMVSHATQENNDAAREEWFRQRMERKKLRQEQDKAKIAVEVVKGRPREEPISAEKRAL